MSERNPFRRFEDVMRNLGDILAYIFVGAFLVVLLIVLPIAGSIQGFEWYRTWAGYLLFGGMAVVFAIMAAVMYFWQNVVVEAWDKAKYKWDRKHDNG